MTPRINLVQCRPLQTRGLGAPVAMPEVADADGVLFATHGDFMGGNVRLPLQYVVTVRPAAYLGLGTSERHGVARLVGAVNRALAGRSFLLMGPGRWGTTAEALGVPARFAEINHATAIVEATYAEGGFRPELNYGSHFFQDLVETGIFYAAVFDERAGVLFHPTLAVGQPGTCSRPSCRTRNRASRTWSTWPGSTTSSCAPMSSASAWCARRRPALR